MKKTILLVLFVFGTITISSAQYLTIPQEGGTKKASVSERIALTDISLNYDRPAVKGREGKIWGQLVHFGFADLGFGSSKAAPWRAGANENTTINFSTDVLIEGRELPAGKYALFMAVQESEVTVIFSKNASSWGSYFYDQAEDALRVMVRPQKEQPFMERLQYLFADQTENSAMLNLLWEKWKIGFKIEVDLSKTVLTSFKNELRNEKGFNWQAWDQAATFAMKYGQPELALTWVNKAIGEPYIGEANFVTLGSKAQILSQLGRKLEADVTMKDAIQKANNKELEQYAEQLTTQKRKVEALEIRKLLATKNPMILASTLSLSKAYAAVADFKNALKTLKTAEAQAINPADKEKIVKLSKSYGDGKE